MTKFEENPSPFLTIVEATEPTAPSAGRQRLYIDSTTHLLKATNSSGTDRTIEGSGSLFQNRVKLASGDLTTTSTTFVDATGLTITGTTGARRCLVGLSCSVFHSANQGSIIIQLDIDGTDEGGTFGLVTETTVTGGNDVHNGSFVYMTAALTAASHTFILDLRSLGY